MTYTLRALTPMHGHKTIEVEASPEEVAAALARLFRDYEEQGYVVMSDDESPRVLPCPDPTMTAMIAVPLIRGGRP